MVKSLIGYLTHPLQTFRQTFLALSVRRKFLSGLRIFCFDANYLKIPILSPLFIQPAFGALAEVGANPPHGRLNLAEASGAYVFQSGSTHINRPAQANSPSGWQFLVLVNDGINPSRSDNVEIRNSLLTQAPARLLITTLGKRVNNEPADHANDADTNSNNNSDGRPIRWDLLRWYHRVILGWASFFTGAGMPPIWWLSGT